MKRFYLGSLLALALLVGCNNSNHAPVSGVVKLDGQPYPNAVVSFQPIGTAENPEPGRGSSAYTDANGKFELLGEGNIKGAVIGKHRVRIMTRQGAELAADPNPAGGSPDGGSPDGAPAKKVVDPIPLEWNAYSNKEFEVSAGGTDQANFDIVTKKK
jgi:hypothetical protein